MTASETDVDFRVDDAAGRHSVHRFVGHSLWRHLDLFSGIGGFALACRMVGGIETIGFSEINTYASSILKRHWPDVPNYGDIRNVRGIKCDIITGGFPCQDISRAGKRAGISGTESGLWREMLRIIDESRPRWVLGENVARLTSDGLVTVLQNLYEIGYDAEWHCVPAYAAGAPHERDRVWIVAYPMQPGETGRWTSRVSRWRGSEGQARQDGWDGTTQGNVQLWSEPNVGRVAYGIPNGVDRINALGNAIVPQVAAEIIKAMKETKI
jgi:DNA (cytosine-5)-methyltransferase 1